MRTRRALTDRAVRNLKPGYHAAGGSLYVQVTPGGSRSWILRTLVRGKRRELGLGSYPGVSVQEAHEHAARLRKVARSGGDPLAERDKGKAAVPSFEEAARSVHAAHKDGWRNTKHAAQWLSTMQRYVFPMFGSLPVNAVESQHVMQALTPIWIKKPETARRVRQRIGLVLDWTKAHRYRTGDNPCDTIADVLPKQRDTEQHHAALVYSELPAFLTGLQKASASESIKLALEFLILTSTRTSETLLATWREIDFEAATWTIPASRMKAGKAHKVPLSARGIEILRAAEKLGGKTYVFPTPGRDAALSNMAMAMLVRRMGYAVTVHGFRSAFRDWAAERTNFPRQVCEAALAHTVVGVESAYLRSDLFEQRRELMQSWAAFACSTPGKVVRLRA